MAERISLSEDAFAEAGAEVVRLEVGRVIRQAAYPHVYDANMVRRPRLSEAQLDLQLEQLAAPLREVGARHLQISTDGAPLSDRVISGLRRRGFLPDRLVAMTAPRVPLRQKSQSVHLRRVPEEAGWDEFGWAMDRLNREEPWYAPAVSREIVGSMRGKADAGVLTLYVAHMRVGGTSRLVGSVGLGRHQNVAQIVSVGTLPDARRLGVGTTMVVELIERARERGAELVYLVARADDGPKDLYRRIGFEVEAAFDTWLKLPA